jgi:hypothetical protein
MSHQEDIFLYNDNFYQRILPIITEMVQHENKRCLEYFGKYPDIAEIVVFATQTENCYKRVFRKFAQTGMVKNGQVKIVYKIPPNQANAASGITCLFAIFLIILFWGYDKTREMYKKWIRSKS